MPVETSMFAQIIQDHLSLKERNSRLEDTMPLGRYKAEDPFDNHPLFKTEEQARIEDTMSGHEVFPEDAPLTLANEDTAEHELPEVESHLWSRSRDFDWGD